MSYEGNSAYIHYSRFKYLEFYSEYVEIVRLNFVDGAKSSSADLLVGGML